MGCGPSIIDGTVIPSGVAAGKAVGVSSVVGCCDPFKGRNDPTAGAATTAVHHPGDSAWNV